MISNLEKKILLFLIDGQSFSDNAIMKNFGITLENLEQIYSSLIEKGFLEPYDEFLKKKPQFSEKNSCCSGNCCNKPEYKRILVLTEKSLNLK